MLSWNQTTPKIGSASSPVDDVTALPNGTFLVGSLSIVADDQGIYLVLNVPSPGGFRPLQIGIMLAERQEAKDYREAAAACSHALVTKFGAERAEEVITFLVKEYGPNWALKYLPLDDRIFELYDEARLITSVVASNQGGDTW